MAAGFSDAQPPWPPRAPALVRSNPQTDGTGATSAPRLRRRRRFAAPVRAPERTASGDRASPAWRRRTRRSRDQGPERHPLPRSLDQPFDPAAEPLQPAPARADRTRTPRARLPTERRSGAGPRRGLDLLSPEPRGARRA